MILAIFLAFLLGTQSAPVLPPSGVIRGHVYDYSTATPINGATVSLTAVFISKQSQNIVTDASGAFVFEHLAATRYRIRVTKEGFATEDEANLYLRDAEQKLGVDLRMWHASSISGNVTDVDGKPLDGVDVQALRKDHFGSPPTLSIYPTKPAEKTDAQGHFCLSGLIPGSYIIEADLGAQNTKSSGFAPSFYPDIANWTDAEAVRIEAGSEYSGYQLKVHEAATFEVTGNVVDLEGHEAAGIQVVIYGEASKRLPEPNAVTDSTGAFRFSGITRGRYDIHAWKPQENPKMPGDTESDSIPVEVVDHDATGIKLALGTELRLRGKIQADDNLRRQFEAENVQVGIALRDPASYSVGVNLNPDGTFVFDNSYPGTYDLSLTGGPSHAFLSQILVGGRDVSESGITISRDNRVVDVTLVIDNHGGSVTGRALDAENHAVASGRVALLAADPSQRAKPRYFRQTKTASNGAFQITNVIPGDYLMVPWPFDAGDLLEPELFRRVADQAVSVRVDPSSTVNKDARLTPEIRAAAGLK